MDAVRTLTSEGSKGDGMTTGKDWDEYAGRYLESLIGPYHEHRLEVILSLIDESDASRIVDFGCGDGILLSMLRGRGEQYGIDLSEEMITSARNRLGPKPSLLVGGVDTLSIFDDASVDLVVAANVLAYLSKEDENEFYRQVARLLKRGGRLVVSHSNELFDLFSLNWFTSEFFSRHFTDTSVAELLRDVATPTRENWFSIRENPLAYREKLRQFGLQEVAQEFINYHPCPPALMEPIDWTAINARVYLDTLNVPIEARWKLNFVCSQFASKSIRM